jgi:NAD(P)-dependent dehydrogenase (short-subunit alcohol dehydrogenase family)
MIPRDYSPAADVLKDRVILVTGAGQGLGKAAALAYAAHGATVVLSGRKVPKLEQTYDAIVDAGGPQPAIFPLDLESATDAEFAGLAQGLHNEFARLDGILHSAAHFVPLAPLAIQTLDQWLALLRVNLAAPFALTRACLPLLKRAESASIVLTSETHAAAPKAYWGGFAVAKAGLHTLTAIWADELEGTPVRINTFIPGPVASPQRMQSHPGEAPATLPKPADLAPAYLYLMASDSEKLRGQVLSWQ